MTALCRTKALNVKDNNYSCKMASSNVILFTKKTITQNMSTIDNKKFEQSSRDARKPIAFPV